MKPCILIVVAHSGCAINRQQNCPHRGRVGVAGVLFIDDPGCVSLVKEYVSHYKKKFEDKEYVSTHLKSHTV